MLADFGCKTLSLKRGDIWAQGRGHLNVLVWKDEISKHSNMHWSPAGGNFCAKHRNALKRATVESYMLHVRCIDENGWIADSC
jgi:hypothetical protein